MNKGAFMNTGAIVIAILFWAFLFMPNAHAYIDPGVGSMLLQALAAGLVGALVFGKRIWLFVSTLFSTKKAGDDDLNMERHNDE